MNKLLQFLLVYCTLLIVFIPFQIKSQSSPKKVYLKIESDSTASLKKIIALKDYNQLIKHLNGLSQNLQLKGFLTSRYSKPIKINDSTYYTLLKKDRLTKQLVIENWQELPKVIKKNAGLKKNNSIPIELLKIKLQQWNSSLLEDGNPFNSIQLSNISSKKDTLYATLNVNGLEKRTIDSIIIKGYEKFPRGFITYYAGIRKNSIYQNKNIEQKTQSLKNISFLSPIKSPEVLFNPDSTQLYLYFKKKNANNFDGFLGFSNDVESDNLVLNGYLNLNLINNLNFGEEINLTYKSDSEEQQQFRLFAKIPYIFKLPLGIEAGLTIFRQKDIFSTTEQKIGFNYSFTPKIEALIGYKKYESADLAEAKEPSGRFDNDFDATFFHTEIRYLDKQNQLLFPVKSKIIFNSEIGSRQQTKNKTNQLKAGLEISHIFQLNKRNSIYISNNTQLLNSSNYLSNELYRLGGILSIRGFEENSLRASLFNVTNTEYRFQLNETIYAHTIVDFAFLDNRTPRSILDNSIVGENQLTSFGIGLGMLTKAGLFKLNYANGKSNTIPFEFGNSKVHLSLTAYF